MRCSYFVSTLPNDIILDWSKFKAFADDKINMTEKLKSVLGRVENNRSDRESMTHLPIPTQ